MKINLSKCWSFSVRSLRSVLLSIVRIAEVSIFANLKNSLIQWVSRLPEYHGIDTLPWLKFKEAYIHSNYRILLKKNNLFATNYSNKLAWERIINEYATLTGATNNIKSQYETLTKRREKLIRIDALFLLAKYNKDYIAELLEFTSQSSVKLAMSYAKVLRSAYNDDYAAYIQTIEREKQTKVDPYEYFFSAEYSISKYMGFNILSESLTVRDMIMYLEKIKADSKTQENGRQ